MAYGTATITSATPGKDLMAALKTQFVAGGMTFVENYASPISATWTSVTYGGGLFVAVASGTATAATSPDGITWTQRSLPVSQSWTSVTYGNVSGGMFVAIATGSLIAASSPDGITWTQRSMPVSSTWSTVAFGGSTFAALASGTTIVATSADGQNWVQQALPLPVSASWTSMAYGSSPQPTFVAVSNGSINSVISTDGGVTWVQKNMSVLSTWSAVTYGGGTFAAVAIGTTIAAISTDGGLTWQQKVLPGSNTNWSSVTYGNSTFVAVSASSNTIAATSPTGVTWTAQTLPATATWNAVTYGGSTFAALSNTSGIGATSANGIAWTQRVLTGTSNSPCADVYKSPAASNQFGQDWYLILRRSSDVATGFFFQVAENYNATTHQISNYGGTGISAVPLPGTYTNPAAALAPDSASAIGVSAALSLTTAAFTYWFSVNPNRLILGAKTSTEIGFYAGLYDDLLPAGVTQFPLMAAKIPTVQTTTGAIGCATVANTGGFTREPLQTAATTLNFEACIHNGCNTSGAVLPGSYTPGTTTAALYGNTGGLSRVMVGSARAVVNASDAVRGLLIGCVNSAVSSVAGDTITAGGKTYTRLSGPATTYGFFVDQAL